MDWFSFIVIVLAGLLLVFAGRKFFWMAAGLVVFILVFAFFDALFNIGWIGILIAIALGLVAGWLATRYIKFIAYIIGGVAGAAALPYLLGMFGITWPWLLEAVIGAAIGLAIIRFAFNWGLIFVTAWVGSTAVVTQIAARWTLSQTIALIATAVLLIAGMVVQGMWIKEKGQN